MKTKRWLPVAGVSFLCAAALFAAAGIVSAKGSGEGRETAQPGDLGMGAVEMGGTQAVLAVPPIDINFNARYVRTDGSHEDVRYPVVRIVRSVRELNAYYEANKEEYDLERRDDAYSDTAVGFLDACDRYDDAYFEDHILVMVLLSEGSGSIRHEVQSVRMGAGGQCHIDIDRVIPEEGTCDIAEWHILIEPEAGVEIESESDITVFVDGINPLTQPELVQYGSGYADISLTIPDGWEYETEEFEGNHDFCVAFWPTGRAEGRISVRYFSVGFSVCGTGLEEEKIRLGNYEARQGTFDNHKLWDFIGLIGTPGDYVVMNEGAGQWWGQYGGEAMEILNTLVVGGGSIGEAEVIAIAKEKATVEYDQTRASYDSESGLWTVSFFRKNTVGGGQTVTITGEGKVVDIQYGE